MTDFVSQEERSKIMSAIKSKDTKPERLVRERLFADGFRYRKNDKRYPGHPDIVLPKYKTVVFVNGCFWHQHPGCKDAHIPETRKEYWEPKLFRNVSRDKKNVNELQEMGWNVIIVWECELRTKDKREERLQFLEEEIRNNHIASENDEV